MMRNRKKRRKNAAEWGQKKGRTEADRRRDWWYFFRRDIKASQAREAACKAARREANERATACREQERANRKELTDNYRYSLRHRRPEPKISRREKTIESDSLVKHGIPSELWALWERDKHLFPRSMPDNERRERFMHHVEEMGARELHAWQQAEADKWIEEAERERAKRDRAESRARLAAEVPF